MVWKDVICVLVLYLIFSAKLYFCVRCCNIKWLLSYFMDERTDLQTVWFIETAVYKRKIFILYLFICTKQSMNFHTRLAVCCCFCTAKTCVQKNSDLNLCTFLQVEKGCVFVKPQRIKFLFTWRWNTRDVLYKIRQKFSNSLDQ